jgi:hypothetical protein
MFPVTYHPGVYERPEQEPYLDIGLLFKSLFRPKEAFEDLYDHTSSTQGIVLAVIFILMAAVISIVASFAVLGSMDLPDDATTLPGAGAGTVTQTVINVFVGLAMFFLSAYMIFHFLSGGKARRPDKDKTIGFLGYAKFPAFIIGILMAIATPIMLSGMDLEALENEDPETVGDALGAVCGLLGMFIGLGAVGFVWSIWVHSHAQSVANDVAVGTAFGYIFLTWFVIMIIEAVIGAVVALAVLGTAF